TVPLPTGPLGLAPPGLRPAPAQPHVPRPSLISTPASCIPCTASPPYTPRPATSLAGHPAHTCAPAGSESSARCEELRPQSSPHACLASRDRGCSTACRGICSDRDRESCPQGSDPLSTHM